MNIEILMQYMSYILAGIGVLAFLVSVIVQVIKEMPGLKKVQTNAVALAAALILTPVSVIVLCTYYTVVIEWYYIFASFIAAFIVYLVSTGGWERVTEMWNRNKYKKNQVCTSARKENIMTEQTVKEIIKSFAYGLSVKEISDNEGTSLETMEKFAEEHAAEIEQKKAELKEGGWYE